MRDDAVRSALAQQQRQDVDRMLRARLHPRQDIEVARAADAQATMLRRNSNVQARLQLLEAEHRARILPEERQERGRILWEAGWAKRRRELDTLETRCRVALLGVYWERIDETSRWAVAMVQMDAK